jgi:predicted nucleic acid-binding protein
MNVNPDLRYFLDTNLLVYAFDRSAGQKRDQAAQLLESFWENENGCLSIQVLQEFFVTTTRKITTPMNHSDARQIVADLAHWRVHAPNIADLLQAIDMQQEHQLSYWDAQIVQSAASSGCTTLLTEDLNHGQLYGTVQVINPFREMV